MSVKAMARVWELQLPHSQRLVLLAMADHADHEGERIFPSLRLTAWKTGYSVRQVQRIIEQLLESKILLTDNQRHGYRGTKCYRLDLQAGKVKPPFSHDKMSTVDKMTIDKMSTHDILTPDYRQNVVGTLDIAMSTEPSVEPTTEPITIPTSAKKRQPSEDDQPGELFPKLTDAIHAMINTEFHLLALPSLANDKFWSAQVKLIDSHGLLTVYEVLMKVDAYYSGNRDKLVLTKKPKDARRRMSFAIDYALHKAEREERYAERTERRPR